MVKQVSLLVPSLQQPNTERKWNISSDSAPDGEVIHDSRMNRNLTLPTQEIEQLAEPDSVMSDVTDSPARLSYMFDLSADLDRHAAELHRQMWGKSEEWQDEIAAAEALVRGRAAMFYTPEVQSWSHERTEKAITELFGNAPGRTEYR